MMAYDKVYIKGEGKLIWIGDLKTSEKEKEDGTKKTTTYIRCGVAFALRPDSYRNPDEKVHDVVVWVTAFNAAAASIATASVGDRIKVDGSLERCEPKLKDDGELGVTVNACVFRGAEIMPQEPIEQPEVKKSFDDNTDDLPF